MKNVFGTAALAAVLVATVLAANPSRGLVLKRQPHVGDSIHYQINASFKYGERTATLSLEQTETVKSVESDGTYKVEAAAKNCKFAASDKEQSLPDNEPVQSTYDSLGSLKQIEPASDANVYRKANMLTITAPEGAVKIGDKWERDIAGDASKSVAAAKTAFEIVSLEDLNGTHTAKVKFTYKETTGYDPISSQGFAWVNTQDGTVISLEANFKNYPMGEGNVPVEGSLSIKRER